MNYPYIAYSPKIDIQPIFKNLMGDPMEVDMSVDSTIFDTIDVRDQKGFQKFLDDHMKNNHTWGVASYLENREIVLSQCPQMVEEQRFYHLGLDIIVPLATPLNAPLDASVKESGYEAGEGNYGGNVLLMHESPYFDTFYSLYGHLNKERLPAVGTHFKAGDPFAFIGDFHENGNWFYHTHLQVITQKGFDQGYLSKGYCAAKDLAIMDSLCPSPLSLFKV
ncbi:MAG: peptidoglycan DD-metalloendopeptidase family protein [Desulfobacula sp.]|nr:peptidoglycan DD-metalloendopeptidase family protein [Desulfobacula sp.]MBT3807054.1 peptidoglycan DD-metalloendopeptidase family protein [Desulfobacula sp.]MBT4201274.1 peptidoglycan DD-metalloendopeptidase family protein [Desulfobacula sp.]MBT5973654.1 peptidoglycan DD-metalloendopeptidase family protein [Desulfobacula sp.]MBT6751712.1 peptidoglycan DD-metalloendopeptidase family protein [Desulfobacula sp.]